MNKFNHILFLLKNLALVLSIFSVFRFLLFVSEFDRIDLKSDSFAHIFQAFLMGVRFDIVISSYILLLPAIFILTQGILNKNFRFLNRFSFYWILILFSISFIVCAIDIPYFNQFFSRFSVGAFEWFDNPKFVFKMIFQEPRYFLYLILLIILLFVFYKIFKKIFSKNIENKQTNIFINITISIAFVLLMILGMRGRIEFKSPIRIGTAYFCENPFLNQLGLNPVFTLMKSYFESQKLENKTIHLMDEKEAFKNVQNYLRITKPKNKFSISRNIIPDLISKTKHNVVLIIMESMSATKMKRHGNNKNLTPFLDSLSNNSIYFENIYTAGKHTFNGVFSTLFSFPAIYRQHPMKNLKKYNGIISELKKQGYSTTYFTNHDGQFDNIEGFLRNNNFDNIISQKNYPSNKIETTLGVPDDFMFEFSIPIIDKLNSDNNPFFVSFMTSSAHSPYFIPEYFTAQNSLVKDQIVEYSDWSLRKFISLASKKEWFTNTIFVFVADHGEAISTNYDISLDYFHSPLIIYAPKIIKNNKIVESIGSQIDVFPTIMGILNLNYENNTLGIDLLKEKRPFAIINDDDKIGILNNELLLILNENTNSKLYKYKKLDKLNYIKNYQIKANEMEKYAKSNLQVFQNIILEK